MITLADVLAQQLRDLPIRVARELMLEVAERRAREAAAAEAKRDG